MPPPRAPRNGQLKKSLTGTRAKVMKISAGNEIMKTKRLSAALLPSPSSPKRPAR